MPCRPGQIAPSAKRRIKTRESFVQVVKNVRVRKHRAPNGALRLTDTNLHVVVVEAVRKHRAPNGALRRDTARVEENVATLSESNEHHKAH